MIHHERVTDKPVSVRSETASIAPYAWIILLIVFMASVAAPLNQFKVPPLLPILMQAFQLNLGQAGMLMSVFAMTGFVLALPAGLILQKVGLKVTGIIAISCLVIGAAAGTFAQSVDILLASRILEGAGMGLIGVAAPSAIALWFPREKQGMAMGLWGTWVPVGNVIMYNLAPGLGLSSGWQTVWWVGAGFALMALILYGLFFRLPSFEARKQHQEESDEPHDARPGLRSAFANRNIWLLGLQFAFFNVVVIGFATYFPTFLTQERGYSLTEAGFIASVSTLVGLISAPLFGWLSDRIGSRRLIFSFPFLMIGAMMLFPFHLTGSLLYMFMIVLGLVSPAIPTATFAAVPEIMRKPQFIGIGLAIVSLGTNLGILMGPILVGSLVERFSWATAGYALIPICILGFVAAWRVNVR